MVDSSSWFFDIFGWDKLMSVLTVFSILASTAFIPLYHLYRKHKEKRMEQYEKEHMERIDRNIRPISIKISELEGLIKDLQNDIKDLRGMLTKTCDEFHRHEERNEEVNKKIYYMEGLFKRITGLRTSREDFDNNI